MNHLAHFKVAHPVPELMVGGFLGDFVKGRLKGEFPERIESGIALHRAVDAFSDRHPVSKRSVERFTPEFRRFGPIIVDVVYDHFLAQSWQAFSAQNLSDFCDEVFSALDNTACLTESAARVALRMRTSRSMEFYGEEQFVERSLIHLSSRLKRDNPLDRAFVEFKTHELELFEDFMLFFPELLEFCKDWKHA